MSSTEPTNDELAKGYAKQIEDAQARREAKDLERLERHGQAAALASQAIEAEQQNGKQAQGFELDAQNQDSAEQRQERNEINGQQARTLAKELNRDNALDRRCIYTGKQISIEMLFSGAVEVDHILPFSATLDDSSDNRLLCMREANREKRKRSPYEAFGHRADWEDIAARAARLPRGKRWRFEPDAMVAALLTFVSLCIGTKVGAVLTELAAYRREPT